MRRRLFDGPDQGLGEEIHLLERLGPPTAPGGCSSLAVCLQEALEACGMVVGYGQVMGQTGAAFMLRVAEGYPASLALEGRDEHATQALREWGREGQLLTAPDPAAAFALCKAEVIAGRPVLALGWGSNPS